MKAVEAVQRIIQVARDQGIEVPESREKVLLESHWFVPRFIEEFATLAEEHGIVLVTWDSFHDPETGLTLNPGKIYIQGQPDKVL